MASIGVRVERRVRLGRVGEDEENTPASNEFRFTPLLLHGIEEESVHT